MSDHEEFYSPDEVAETLGLHVRTVRRFIREGKLAGVRIGKQYRIAASELRKFTGSREPEREATPSRTEGVFVSATVDIDKISRQESDRIMNLTNAFGSLRQGQGRRRLDFYYEARGRLRIVINAELSLTNAVLGMIAGILDTEHSA